MAYTETAEAFFARLSKGGLQQAPQLERVVEFTIEGDGGGVWTLDLQSREIHAKDVESLGKKADVLVRARERDFMALVEGRMSAQDGLLTERLHLAGEAGAIGELMDALSALRLADS